MGEEPHRGRGLVLPAMAPPAGPPGQAAPSGCHRRAGTVPCPRVSCACPLCCHVLRPRVSCMSVSSGLCPHVSSVCPRPECPPCPVCVFTCLVRVRGVSMCPMWVRVLRVPSRGTLSPAADVATPGDAAAPQGHDEPSGTPLCPQGCHRRSGNIAPLGPQMCHSRRCQQVSPRARPLGTPPNLGGVPSALHVPRVPSAPRSSRGHLGTPRVAQCSQCVPVTPSSSRSPLGRRVAARWCR